MSHHPQEFSEFSYGYAVVREIERWGAGGFSDAPFFPSLILEGRIGYDVLLRFATSHMFLQFKSSHFMVRGNAFERAVLGGARYYRMPLHPKSKSRQHELLIDLETEGEEVYYMAPAFHRMTDFNRAFISRRVCEESLAIAPSQIGPLDDDDEHYVIFRGASRPYVCSKPRPIDGEYAGKRLLKRRRREGYTRRIVDVENDLLVKLARVISSEDQGESIIAEVKESRYTRYPMLACIDLALRHLNCALVFTFE